MNESKVLDPQAWSALKYNQRKLDSDGEFVGVSRQALEELLAAYEALHQPCLMDHTPNEETMQAILEIREPAWVEFVGTYGQIFRVRNRNVLALHTNADVDIKLVNMEYKGPVTYIEYGPATSEDGTGTVVRGTLDEVQDKLDGRA